MFGFENEFGEGNALRKDYSVKKFTISRNLPPPSANANDVQIYEYIDSLFLFVYTCVYAYVCIELFEHSFEQDCISKKQSIFQKSIAIYFQKLYSIGVPIKQIQVIHRVTDKEKEK